MEEEKTRYQSCKLKVGSQNMISKGLGITLNFCTSYVIFFWGGFILCQCCNRLYLVILHRREVLQTWKNKQGLQATYGNLLEIFVRAGHGQCAETVCDVLKKRGTMQH